MTEDTAPTFDDLVATVNDPAGTPASKKAKLINVTGSVVNAQTGTSYTVLTGDYRKLVTHTNGSAIAVTLPQASATFPANWFYWTQNRGAGAVTITPTTSTIDGAATLVLNTNEGAVIFSDGTNYFTFRGKTIVGAGGGAPATATYITQIAESGLSAEQALAALATGILKNTTTTGVLSIAAAGTDYVAPGGALGTPSSGTLTNCTADGTNAVGFKTIPQNSQSADYTTVLGDSGKHIFHPAADTNARTYTIDSNANVAYPVGTAITFINMTANVVSIAITADTMYLSSAGTTGTRALAIYGVATAIKMTTTTWIISGSGLS